MRGRRDTGERHWVAIIGIVRTGAAFRWDLYNAIASTRNRNTDRHVEDQGSTWNFRRDRGGGEEQR